MPKTPQSFIVGATEVFVDKRGLIDAKGAYAGTSICMMDGVKFLIQSCGFSLDEALLAATYTPARAIGLQDMGRIEGALSLIWLSLMMTLEFSTWFKMALLRVFLS